MVLSIRFLCGRVGKIKLEVFFFLLVNYLFKIKFLFFFIVCFGLCNMISMLWNKYENWVEVLNCINFLFILILLLNI